MAVKCADQAVFALHHRQRVKVVPRRVCGDESHRSERGNRVEHRTHERRQGFARARTDQVTQAEHADQPPLAVGNEETVSEFAVKILDLLQRIRRRHIGSEREGPRVHIRTARAARITDEEPDGDRGCHRQTLEQSQLAVIGHLLHHPCRGLRSHALDHRDDVLFSQHHGHPRGIRRSQVPEYRRGEPGHQRANEPDAIRSGKRFEHARGLGGMRFGERDGQPVELRHRCSSL